MTEKRVSSKTPVPKPNAGLQSYQIEVLTKCLEQIISTAVYQIEHKFSAGNITAKVLARVWESRDDHHKVAKELDYIIDILVGKHAHPINQELSGTVLIYREHYRAYTYKPEPTIIIEARLIDRFRDGGTLQYRDEHGNEYYVWKPTGMVYSDSKHVYPLKGVKITDVDEPMRTAFWNGEHSPYHVLPRVPAGEVANPNTKEVENG